MDFSKLDDISKLTKDEIRVLSPVAIRCIEYKNCKLCNSQEKCDNTTVYECKKILLKNK